MCVLAPVRAWVGWCTLIKGVGGWVGFAWVGWVCLVGRLVGWLGGRMCARVCWRVRVRLKPLPLRPSAWMPNMVPERLHHVKYISPKPQYIQGTVRLVRSS